MMNVHHVFFICSEHGIMFETLFYARVEKTKSYGNTNQGNSDFDRQGCLKLF
jgi:hypothetical protein